MKVHMRGSVSTDKLTKKDLKWKVSLVWHENTSMMYIQEDNKVCVFKKLKFATYTFWLCK